MENCLRSFAQSFYDDFPPDSAEEEEGYDKRHELSEQEGPPDIFDPAGLRQKPGGRDQNDQLAAHGHDQRVDTAGESLEDRSEDNGDRCEGET